MAKNGAQGWNESYLCNLTRSILNNPIPSTFCPIFAQLEHLCAKLLHKDCNDAHRCKGQPKNAHEKKEPSTLTHTTKTTWKGRYTCQVHTSQYLLSRSNSRRSSPIPTYTQIGKKEKNKGCWLGKLTQKVILQIKFPLFGLQHPPTCPLSIHPPNHPVFTLCAPLWRCTVCEEHNTTSKQLPTTKEGGKKSFFCLNPPFSRIFRAVTEQCNTTLFPYFILHLFYNNPIINLKIVLQRHKFCFLCCFFIWFWIFLDNVIYFVISMRLCMYFDYMPYSFVPVPTHPWDPFWPL